jgi:ATP-dependent protease ClpP protease subunit
MKSLTIRGVILDACEEYDGFCSAETFVSTLNSTDEDVEIEIDSVGGSVYGSRAMSFAIAKWVLEHPDKEIHVQIGSLCASAAFNLIVALPKSCKVTAYSNSLLMAHSCAGGAMGNPEDLRSTADEMDKINQTVIDGLMMKTTLPVKQIKEAFMAGHEMWLTGKEAQECGLVNELDNGQVFEGFTACISSKYASEYNIEQIVATYKLKKETIMEEENKDTIIAEENQTVITAEATETEETTEETATAENTEETEETTAETEETEETQECEDEEKTALKAQNAELTNKITALEAEISELKATIEKYKPTAKANKPSEKVDWLTMVKELNAKHLPEHEYAKAYIALKNEHNAEFKAFMSQHTSR